MILISILIFLVAIALPSFNKQLSLILLSRISTIILIYAGVLSFNTLYIQSIGSGIGIYSDLFHVTFVSQHPDTETFNYWLLNCIISKFSVLKVYSKGSSIFSINYIKSAVQMSKKVLLATSLQSNKDLAVNNIIKDEYTNIEQPIYIQLSPHVIDSLPIITGDDSYTLYNLDSLIPNRKLLEFNDLNKNKYYILEGWLKNQSNVDMIIGTTALVSPMLIYRGLINTYVNLAHPIRLSKGLNEVDLQKFLLERQKLILKFNKVSIPLLAIYVGYLGSYHQTFKSPVSNITTGLGLTSNSLISIGLISKLPGWIKIMWIPLLGLFIKFILLPFTEEYFPSFYTDLADLYSVYGMYLFTYPFFIWMVLVTLFNILEFAIYLSFRYKNGKLIISESIPNRTKKWLESLDERANSNFKEMWRKFYIQHIIVVVTITIITFILLCIY